LRRWRVAVRTRGKVERVNAGTAEEALDALEARTRVAVATARRGTIDVRYRRFEPEEQVVARVELRGPGVRAGLDVRGDATVQAWSGRIGRRALPGDDPYDALRRALLR
jgi:hypothetical protein